MSQASSPCSSSSKPALPDGWRAKLYELENTGTWLDQGTGFVDCQMTAQHFPALVMLSEGGDKVLLQSKIQSDELYEKQGESLILWKEAGYSPSIDYALSFQDTSGCAAIWEAIRAVQTQYVQQREYGAVPSFARTHRIVPADDAPAVVEDSSTLYHILPDVAEGAARVKAKLDNLHPSQRDYVSAQLLDANCSYFASLFKAFQLAEAEAKTVELALLADVLRAVTLLNDPSLVEYLLSDEAWPAVCGIFEYDRALRNKGEYRRFFQAAGMKQVLVLSAEMRSAAAFLFRLRYLRDIMLHPAVDEPGVTAINSMITFTSGEICYQILTHGPLMRALFSVILGRGPQGEAEAERDANTPAVEGIQMEVPSSSTAQAEACMGMGTPTETDAPSASAPPPPPPLTPSPLDGLRFLRELISLSKFIVLDKRAEIYRAFLLGAPPATSGAPPQGCRREFFSLLLHLLGGCSRALRGEGAEEEVFGPEALGLVAEILSAFASTVPALLRLEVFEGVRPPAPPTAPSAGAPCLLHLVIDLLVHARDTHTSSAEHLGDVLRAVLDFDRPAVLGPGPRPPSTEKDRFLPLWYESYAAWLLLPYTSSSTSSVVSRRVVLELLTHCITAHSYRAKYFLIRGNYLSKIISATFSTAEEVRHSRAPPRCLQVLALKLLKAVVRLKDEFYLRHLQKLDAFRPIFAAFRQQQGRNRDNCVTAALYDCVDCIGQLESSLVGYLVEHYGGAIEEAQGRGGAAEGVFEGLRRKHAQMQTQGTGTGTGTGTGGAETAAVPALVTPSSSSSRSSTHGVRRDGHREAVGEDDYFFGDDDENEEVQAGSASPIPSAASSPRSPHHLRQPVSPPHYSHCPHGSPLDGEVVHEVVHDLLQEDEEVLGSARSSLPPLRSTSSAEDEDTGFSCFQRNSNSNGHNSSGKGVQLGCAPIASTPSGVSFAVLKKKRPRLM